MPISVCVKLPMGLHGDIGCGGKTLRWVSVPECHPNAEVRDVAQSEAARPW